MVTVLFWVAALFAVIIGTMAGFGSSTIFLPIALFFVDFKTALILVAILHISGNIGKIIFFRTGFSKKLLFTFGIASVALSLIGAFLVNYVAQEALKMILGVFLLSFVVLSFVKPKLKIKRNVSNQMVGGGLSGFFAGLIGTGGAIRGAFLQAFQLEKMTYIVTAAAISLAVDITRIPIYIGSGFLTPEFYPFIPLLVVIAIVGAYIGRRIVGFIPQELFRKVVLVAIGLVSLKFIIDGLV